MKYFTGDPSAILLPLLTDAEQSLLTDDDLDGDVPFEEILQTHIEWAESKADSYATGRYPGLALATATPAYRHAILVLARRTLLSRRGYSTPELDQDFEDTMGFLRDLHAERASLDPNPNGVVTDDSAADGEVIFGLGPSANIFQTGFAV